jgi:probable HAF family extracellular repeat protein
VSVAWANRYSIVDLGARVEPVGINKAGVVAALSNEFPARGEVYRGGRWRNLPPFSFPTAINLAGNVTGTDLRGSLPMYWPHIGEPVALELPGEATTGFASGINDDDEVTGRFQKNSRGDQHCFVWTPEAGAVDIGGDRFQLCEPRGINNAGQVTGRNEAAFGNRYHAFLWDGAEFIDLGVLAGTSRSEGISTNASGQVVGASFKEDDKPVPFFWDGEMVDLDAGRSHFAATPLAINDSGEIVGWAQTSDVPVRIAVRFAHSKVVHLSSEVTNLGAWQLDQADAINNRGVIVGTGVLDAEPHGFMLLPEKD